MKIKLHDYESEFEDDVTFGTCEMCMYVGDAEYPYFYFRHEDGLTEKVGGFTWDYGALYTIYVDNIPAFAAWLNEQDFEEGFRIENYTNLKRLVDKYFRDKEREDN